MQPAPIAIEKHKFRVTYHAVTRYIQRILGVVVSTPAGASHKAIALAHCDAVSKTMDDIKTIILCPAVITACLAGMTTVSTRSFRVIVTPATGVVVTVAEPHGRRVPRRKLQLKSRREHHKITNELNRRQKRRPSARQAEPEGAD